MTPCDVASVWLLDLRRRDPFAETLTAPSSPSAQKPVEHYVSEAELIGGGIVNRNWEDAEEDGIGRFKKAGRGTHQGHDISYRSLVSLQLQDLYPCTAYFKRGWTYFIVFLLSHCTHFAPEKRGGQQITVSRIDGWQKCVNDIMNIMC